MDGYKRLALIASVCWHAYDGRGAKQTKDVVRKGQKERVVEEVWEGAGEATKGIQFYTRSVAHCANGRVAILPVTPWIVSMILKLYLKFRKPTWCCFKTTCCNADADGVLPVGGCLRQNLRALDNMSKWINFHYILSHFRWQFRLVPH